jgi:cyanophycin synthetase
LIIREDSNRRGRKDGEIAELLRQSALTAGMDDAKIHIKLEEMDAARAAIDRAERDDLVVLLVDSPRMIWQELEKRASLRGQLL